MKTRTLTAVLLAAATFLLATGCGNDASSTAAKDSNTPTVEKKSTPKTTESGSSGSSSSGSSSGDSSDLSKALAELGSGQLADCLSLYTSYGSLYAAALGGKDAEATAQTAVDNLRKKLPSALSDDLDTVANAIKTLATDGMIKGGQAMDTPEYKKADENITAFFKKACGDVTGN